MCVCLGRYKNACLHVCAMCVCMCVFGGGYKNVCVCMYVCARTHNQPCEYPQVVKV